MHSMNLQGTMLHTRTPAPFLPVQGCRLRQRRCAGGWAVACAVLRAGGPQATQLKGADGIYIRRLRLLARPPAARACCCSARGCGAGGAGDRRQRARRGPQGRAATLPLPRRAGGAQAGALRCATRRVCGSCTACGGGRGRALEAAAAPSRRAALRSERQRAAVTACIEAPSGRCRE